jgi:hypothetical protein
MSFMGSVAALFDQGLGTSALLIALGLLVMFVVLLRAKSRVRQDRNETPTRSFRRTVAFGSEPTQAALEQLVCDLQDYSRDTLAKLDTKARILSKLIIDADQRIARLQNLVGSTSSQGQAAAPGSAALAATQGTKDEVLVSIKSRQPGKEGQALEMPGRAAKADGLIAQTSDGVLTACAEPPDREHEKIWVMQAAGRNSTQIAADLNIPRGEVELVLAMQPRRNEGI